MDKNKIIEAAAKLVAKGAYDKAIKEYQKVLDADPRDVRILQKMGELYQKKNDNAQAAHYFTKVAESYATDGFFLKAVALYKQVLKLDGSLVEVNLKLAELHQQLQLMSEAMAYYQIVANHYDKAGDTKRSLDTLRKMVDLDPDNVASRIKLAELYARESMNSEAVGEFRRASEHLKRNNRLDDYLRVTERISALEPENLPLAKELAEIYLSKGDQKRALAKLQVCFKADSRDIDTLKLLAQAFQGLGQTSKTVSVFKELAKVYSDKGRHEDAEQIWRQVEGLDPNDPDVIARRPAASRQAPIPSPPPPRPAYPQTQPPPMAGPAAMSRSAAPAAQAPAPAASREGLNLAKLLTETDVYVKYGLHDKALEHLRKIFSLDPENIDAHEKAYGIYVASNNHAQAGDQLLNVLRLHTRRKDAERAQPYLQTILHENPHHPEVPVFLAALKLDGSHGVQEESESAEEAILVDSNDDEIIVADAPEDALAQDVALHAASSEGDTVTDGGSGESGLGFELESPSGDEPFARESDELVDDDVVDDDMVDDAVDDVTTEASMAYELGEELPTQIAPLPSLVVPQPRPSPHPHPAARARPALVPEPEPELVMEDEPIEAPPEDEPAGEECEEAGFFIEQGLYDEAREILETILVAYPNHRRAAEMLSQVEAQRDTGPKAAQDVSTEEPDGERDAFDLAAELASELGEAESEPSGPISTGGDDFQYSVDEVFSEFKKGLAKVVKPEDVETHYDLGIAYKEMGLIDDAIGEFVVARQGCVGQRKEIDCLASIGHLQLLKSDAPAAVDAYLQALTSSHATGETEKAVRYELALAYEQAGSHGKALGQFMKVNALDPSYREVSAMVERLSAVATPEDDAAPKSAKKGGTAPAARKVGYL